MRAPQATPDAHGSRTLTTTATPADGGAPAADESENPRDVGALRLRGRAMPTQRVQWTQETVDNEGLNRKKSKSQSSPPSRLVPPAPADTLPLPSLLHLPQAETVRRVLRRIRQRLGRLGRFCRQPPRRSRRRSPETATRSEASSPPSSSRSRSRAWRRVQRRSLDLSNCEADGHADDPRNPSRRLGARTRTERLRATRRWQGQR